MRVYHLADLHLRNGDSTKARYNEYHYVFTRFTEYIKSQSKTDMEKSIIVICGDIFHQCKVEGPAIRLFYDFLTAIAKIVNHTFIIRGNHDIVQHDTTSVDLLASLLINEIDGLTYIDETCVIDLYTDIGHHFDACIGVLDIKDMIKIGNTNSKELDQKCDFPEPIANRKHRIALFHGVPPGNSSEFFKGYNIAMLGDIHQQQIFNGVDDPTATVGYVNEDIKLLYRQNIVTTRPLIWAYSGSMIRQTFGEDENGHGFLMWNLSDSTVTAYHIDNIMENRDVKESLIKSQISKFDKVDIDDENERSDPDNEDDIEESNHHIRSTPQDWINYLGHDHKGVELVKNAQLLIPEDCPQITSSKFKERQDKVAAKFGDYMASVNPALDSFERKPFKFIKMTWDWVLCYGPKNTFDFGTLDKKINILGGKNGQGKSSFMETILLAVYGTGFPSRTNKTYSGAVINYKKPPGEMCKTQIVLKCAGGTMVRISRNFYKHTGQTKLHTSSKKSTLDFWDSDGWVNEKSGKISVDDWIDQNIGPIDSFLLSCMVGQNADADFFNLSPADQKEMLDRALKIDTHTKYVELLRESRLALQWSTDMIGSQLMVHVKNDDDYKLQNLDEKLASIKNIETIEQKKPDTINKKPKSYYEKLLKNLPDLSPPSEDELATLPLLISELAMTAGAGGHNRYNNYTSKVTKSLEQLRSELAATATGPELPDDDCGYDIGPYNDECEACIKRKQAKMGRENHDQMIKIRAQLVQVIKQRISDIQERVDTNEQRNSIISSIAEIDATANEEFDLYMKNLLEKQRLTDAINARNANATKIGELKTIKDRMDARIHQIITLSSDIEGFVAHLYVTTVIPKIEELSNQIIHLIDPALSLRGKMDSSQKKIEWTVSNCNQETEISPPIEKASGFQRFIAGLAMRIALGSSGLGVGALGFQLFLDEGFTSCDSTNLARVPEFLNTLLTIYDSILLVTHLDILKDDTVANILNIQVDETGLSRIIIK